MEEQAGGETRERGGGVWSRWWREKLDCALP